MFEQRLLGPAALERYSPADALRRHRPRIYVDLVTSARSRSASGAAPRFRLFKLAPNGLQIVRGGLDESFEFGVFRIRDQMAGVEQQIHGYAVVPLQPFVLVIEPNVRQSSWVK